MDIQPQSTQPISDDQELAKVLAGVNAEADGDTPEQLPPIETTPPLTPPAVTDDAASAVDPAAQTVMADPAPLAPPAVSTDGGDLSSVKQEAIVELRPLVDKLNLSPDEKFDTYLLLIRSTDDKSLIAPAHEAAKAIADEAKRAQALLDIIKEIDFLSGQPQ